MALACFLGKSGVVGFLSGVFLVGGAGAGMAIGVAVGLGVGVIGTFSLYVAVGVIGTFSLYFSIGVAGTFSLYSFFSFSFSGSAGVTTGGFMFPPTGCRK